MSTATSADATTSAATTATTAATTAPPTTGTPSTLSSAATWTAFAVEPDAWEVWKPVLAGVRPATDGDIAALTARAHSVLSRSYTATAVGYFGELEVTQSPARARVRFGIGRDTYLEVHKTRPAAPPTGLESLLDGPATVCFHQERACVALTGEEKARDKPHLFDNMTDSLLFQASAVVTGQQLAPAMLGEARDKGAATGVATVASPIGQLDCVLLVETVGALDGLEGARLDPDSHERDYAGLCVDARGLVVLSPGAAFLPMTPYLSLRPSAQKGFDTVPFPVRAYQP